MQGPSGEGIRPMSGKSGNTAFTGGFTQNQTVYTGN